MHKSFILGVVFTIITGAALASETGRDAYRKCKACHSVIAPDGDFIVRGGMVGPNLYGIADRPAAAIDGYRYSKSLTQAGEMGLKWDKSSFTAFVQDPMIGFLREVTRDPKARGRMGYALEDTQEINLIWDYLLKISE